MLEAPDQFFIEEPEYWQPGHDANSIYQQISKKKYRKIQREQIQFVMFADQIHSYNAM